tara:strand:- start:2927 stop:3295 length:369 start_codon:yes stop_codon:yes gene_type:complete
MFGERERSIKNLVIDALGGAESYRRARQQTDEIDDAYVQIESRRSSVVVRRLAIFVVLYVLIVMTAIVVVRSQTGQMDVVLWVGVGTFNAASAGIYYAQYQKRRLALEVLNVLRNKGEESAS